MFDVITRYRLRSAGAAATSAEHTAPPDIPANLDFNNLKAVRKAHRRLTEAPALVRFCDRTFDGQDPAAVRNAAATLLLYKCADEAHQGPAAIEQSRKAALATLADRLSPVGTDELRQTLEASPGGNAFFPYLAHADRLCLAAQNYMKAADACARMGQAGPAARSYLLAAEAYALSGQDRQAAAAYQSAAEGFMLANQPDQAALADRMAAESYVTRAEAAMQAGVHATAARDYQTAAELYALAGQPEQVANAYRMAAECYVTRAEAAMQAGVHATAAREYQTAAEIYARAGQPEQVANAYGMAADAFMLAAEAAAQAGVHATAAREYQTAAQIYARAGQPEQVANAYRMAADAFMKTAETFLQAELLVPAQGAYSNAAAAYAQAGLPEQAANAYILATQHEPAADIYLAMASAYAQTDQRRQAAITYQLAAEHFSAAWRHGPAADAFQTAAELYEGQGLLAQASEAYGLAAVHYMNGHLPERAGAAWDAADRTAANPAGLSSFSHHPPDDALKSRIVEAISARLLSLTSDNEPPPGVPKPKIRMDSFQCYLSMSVFAKSGHEEWCLLRRDDEGMFDLITAKAGAELIQHAVNHPYLRRRLQEGDLLRGEAVLAELLQLAPDEPEAARQALNAAITKEMKARVQRLSSADGLRSGARTLHLTNDRGVGSDHDFDPSANVAWYLVSQDDEQTRFFFIPAATADQLLATQGRHPFLLRALKDEDLLRQQDVLAALLVAPLDPVS